MRSVLLAGIELTFICVQLSQLTWKGWGLGYESLAQNANAKIPENLQFTTADGSRPQVQTKITKPPHSFTCMSTHQGESARTLQSHTSLEWADAAVWGGFVTETGQLGGFSDGTLATLHFPGRRCYIPWRFFSNRQNLMAYLSESLWEHNGL